MPDYYILQIILEIGKYFENFKLIIIVIIIEQLIRLFPKLHHSINLKYVHFKSIILIHYC